jgi:hypothetical protein
MGEKRLRIEMDTGVDEEKEDKQSLRLAQVPSKPSLWYRPIKPAQASQGENNFIHMTLNQSLEPRQARAAKKPPDFAPAAFC